MKKSNPFTLTFGKIPNEYISRYETIDSIISNFDAGHPISQSYLIAGVRGSGKTVLMTAITRELSDKENWVVIDLNSTQDLLTDFCMRLADSCRKMPDLLQAGFQISFAGFGIGINGNPSFHDNVSMIESMLTALKKKHKRVLITIDEVMHDQNMRLFSSEFQLLIRRDYPVFLLMTGLYETIYAIQNDPALTFLLRAPKVFLDSLSTYQIVRQYEDIFETDSVTAKTLADITKGYAFAFQALGMLYYEYRDSLSLEKIVLKLEEILDDFVYKKIWEGLSAQDRAVVLAVSDQERKVQDICRDLSMTTPVFSRYRDRLIKKGLVKSVRHGYLTLTLPRFASIASLY